MDEMDQIIRDMSLRYQLQPGRFQHRMCDQSRFLAFMVNAPEWLPAASRLHRVVITPDGSGVAIDSTGGMFTVKDGIKALSMLIEDAIERAELGEEDAEYLRSMPRVENNSRS